MIPPTIEIVSYTSTIWIILVYDTPHYNEPKTILDRVDYGFLDWTVRGVRPSASVTEGRGPCGCMRRNYNGNSPRGLDWQRGRGGTIVLVAVGVTPGRCASTRRGEQVLHNRAKRGHCSSVTSDDRTQLTKTESRCCTIYKVTNQMRVVAKDRCVVPDKKDSNSLGDHVSLLWPMCRRASLPAGAAPKETQNDTSGRISGWLDHSSASLVEIPSVK
jgi:hypothetical protein